VRDGVRRLHGGGVHGDGRLTIAASGEGKTGRSGPSFTRRFNATRQSQRNPKALPPS